MTEQITLKEALELVDFRYTSGKWHVVTVKGNCDIVEGNCDSVRGKLYFPTTQEDNQ